MLQKENENMKSFKAFYYDKNNDLIATESLYCNNIEKAYEMAEHLKENHPDACIYKWLQKVRKY